MQRPKNMDIESFLTLLLSDGSQRQVRGYKPAQPRPGTASYAGNPKVAERLPVKVDLRPMMTPVEAQGDTQSCVANAAAGAYEYLQKRHLGEEGYDVSRLFVYFNARNREVAENEAITDSGSCIQDAIAGLQEDGACSEDTWPFDPELVNEPPSDAAYAEAKSFLVEEAQFLPHDLNLWKTALAAGQPIIFAVKLFPSFDQLRRGVVPTPSDQDLQTGTSGGHCMLCVGYSEPDKIFIVRNSWGAKWGDQGYCYIPYSYVMREDLNNGDAWIIKRVDPIEPDESSWSQDDDSILETLDGYLHDLSDADYNDLVGAMGAVPLEVRLALLFLKAATSDGHLDASEVETIARSLQPVLDQLGSTVPVKTLIQNSKQLLSDQALIESSINLFNGHLSDDVLAGILNQIIAITSVDDTEADQEGRLIDRLASLWQLEISESNDEDEESAMEESDREASENDADNTDEGGEGSDSDSSEQDIEDAEEGDGEQEEQSDEEVEEAEEEGEDSTSEGDDIEGEDLDGEQEEETEETEQEQEEEEEPQEEEDSE